MVRGVERCEWALVVVEHTCSGLVQTKQEVKSSNINVYNRKFIFVGPDGSSGQLATRRVS